FMLGPLASMLQGPGLSLTRLMFVTMEASQITTPPRFCGWLERPMAPGSLFFSVTTAPQLQPPGSSRTLLTTTAALWCPSITSSTTHSLSSAAHTGTTSVLSLPANKLTSLPVTSPASRSPSASPPRWELPTKQSLGFFKMYP
nr:hypothetical 15.1K protein - bovine adenovirus 3 [Bovine adenovirus 3]